MTKHENRIWSLQFIFFNVIGDGRIKTPLSPTIGGSEQQPFSMGHVLGGSSIQLGESSVHPLVASHSHSSGIVGQMQFGNGAGSFRPPHRGQATLSSRRSQSREDLSSSLAEAHMVKVWPTCSTIDLVQSCIFFPVLLFYSTLPFPIWSTFSKKILIISRI